MLIWCLFFIFVEDFPVFLLAVFCRAIYRILIWPIKGKNREIIIYGGLQRKLKL